MHPILFQAGPITIYSYGAMIALSIVLCAWALSRDARLQNISGETIYDLIFWVVMGGILGARVFYIFLTWDYFSQSLIEIIMIQRGGLAWQGGLMGGALAGVFFARHKKLALRPLLDLSAPYIALGQSIGRVGCFLNGCCYGKPLAWGIYFPTFGEHLHPTQLYETTGLLAAFFILKFAQKKPHQPGMIFVLYLWLAALERFIVEFFRADHETLWLGLSLFQYISLGFMMLGLMLLRRFK